LVDDFCMLQERTDQILIRGRLYPTVIEAAAAGILTNASPHLKNQGRQT